MKSYTDIEQSKKLAEFLPLESADMYYEEVCNLPKVIVVTKVIVGNYILHNQCMTDKDYKKLSNPVLSPAWSLAALLDTLPKIDNYRLEIRYIDKGYCCCYTEENNGGDLYWYYADNPIDACYEMIIKLHELKML